MKKTRIYCKPQKIQVNENLRTKITCTRDEKREVSDETKDRLRINGFQPDTVLDISHGYAVLKNNEGDWCEVDLQKENPSCKGIGDEELKEVILSKFYSPEEWRWDIMDEVEVTMENGRWREL